jgi:hypothetical protein
MNRVTRSAAVIVLALIADTANAQTDGPKAGTWAAEASSGPSASLLKFRNDKSAWVFGITALYQQENEEPTPPGVSLGQDVTLVQARLGFRRYGLARDRMRPFSTISGIVGYEDFGVQKGWQVGAAAEVGASWFFSPHVSMGAAGDLSLTYGKADRDFGFGTPATKITTITAQFSGFRLLGAVYF